MRLKLLSDRLAVCWLPAQAEVPAWATAGGLTSITRTGEELSVVCAEASVPEDVRHAPGWRALQVEGPLDFALVGVLASLATPLAAAGVSIFALSTFDTDYVLVRDSDVETGIAALTAAGHQVWDGPSTPTVLTQNLLP